MTIGLLKQALHALRHESFGRVPLWVHRWFKWLAPGLLVKRWLVLSALGVFLATIGFAIWLKLTPVFYTTQFVGFILTEVAETVPSYISGPLAMASGLLLVWWGQARTLSSITEALMPEGDEALVDVLIAHRRLHRGPRVVVIGGGTGLSNLLRGLKHYSANITAVVTVADDGGSSGRLRREIGVLPPGDIRNCLTALADEEKLMTELFRYRFQAGDGLSGHSFGNLFLTAMSEITGDLEQAIAASSRVLAVRGQVLPATLADVCLWAELTDGRRVEGESNITEAGGAIARIGCKPAHPPALPKAVKAIQDADLIVIGPGSLYTSIIPNLLVPDIADAIAQSKAPRIYVCNIMTQEGETQGYSVGDHIRAIDRACGRRLFEAVLVQKQSPSAKALIRYAKQNSNPVPIDRDVIGRLGRRVILANVMQENEETGQLRHNPYALAKVLMRWFARVQ